MSNTWKVVIGIVVILLIIWGIKRMTGSSNVPVSTTNQTSTVNTANTANNPTPANSNSDTALSQDSTNVDAQMNKMNQDSAAVDQSFNDKPVTQTE